MRALVVVLLLGLPSVARADSRGVIRIGVTPVDLAVDESTPYVGERVDDAVYAYNLAVAAYNESHGYGPGSPMATEEIGPGDLGVRATLLTIAPALEAGHENAFVRVELLLGFADDLRQYGAGFYPFNLAGRVKSGSAIVAYVSAGGTASWLDRPSTPDEVGALLSARGALGLRLGRRITLEAGYAHAVGALVDRDRISDMEDYDPRGDAPPPPATEAIAGGEQRGLVDVSLGVSF